MEHIPKIVVRVIDPSNQRYNTVGDWIYDAEDHALEIRVSRMPGFKSELAIAIHEIVESVLCIQNDISETDVTVFDVTSELESPGDSADAPYHAQHMQASAVEKEVCSQIELSWSEHEENCKES